MSDRRLTIEDIAKLSGVSRGTVSRVLNGNSNVKTETKEKVLKVIRRTGYSPQVYARRTAGAKSYTISIVLPMIGTDFYARLIKGIEEKLHAEWHIPALFPILSRERLVWLMKPDVPVYDYDGIILCSLVPERLFPAGYFLSDKPVLLVDGFSPSYDSIYVDNFLGGYLAGNHLVKYDGPQFIILMKEEKRGPFIEVFTDRLSGFTRAVTEKGGSLPQDHIFRHDLSMSAGSLALRDIVQKHGLPVNIFATCDLYALGIIEEANRLGLRIRKDIRLVGFDDHEWTGELGITTIHQPIEEMGRTAAELMLKRLQGDKSAVRNICFKPELVIRDSA
ncbi:MAG: LacI family transcriptional regulator [Spirochaetes bacterium]|nr:MAG: LacI family transcriptional regulator [Spirochaetota bacterium]